MNQQNDIIRKIDEDLSVPSPNWVAASEKMEEQNLILIQSALKAIEQEDLKELNMILLDQKRYRDSFSPLPKEPEERFFYELGINNSSFKIFTKIRYLIPNNAETSAVFDLLGKKHVKELLTYLHDNPNSRQITIADEIGIKPNYLSEILNKLLSKKWVQRYGKNKHTQYCLTKIGENIFQRYLSISSSTVIDMQYYNEFFEKYPKVENKQQNYQNQIKEHKENGYEKWKKNRRSDLQSSQSIKHLGTRGSR